MSTDLVSRDSLAERSGGVWDYISPSRLSMWLTCPLKFRLRYVDGVVTPTSPAMFIGKMVHTGLEAWYRHRQLGLSLDNVELHRRMFESWGPRMDAEHVQFDSVAAEEASLKQTAGLIAAYLAHVAPDEPKPLAVETAIEAPLVDPVTNEDLGIPLVGVIDLVLPESDGPTIADFKSVARSGEPLEIMHEIQLSSYSYLFRRASPEPEGALEIRNLVKTKTPQVQFHRYGPRTNRHFQRLFSVIRAYLDDLDSGRFIFRPGLGCSSCEFRTSFCRVWPG